jgi:hypothetical protein
MEILVIPLRSQNVEIVCKRPSSPYPSFSTPQPPSILINTFLIIIVTVITIAVVIVLIPRIFVAARRGTGT